MTSSLVGSEMCIRDSLPSAWCLQGQQQKPVRQEAARPKMIRQNLKSSMSVSYTHLTLPTICSV
eukprot:6421388-Prorocentrum_lima.AAC.1